MPNRVRLQGFTVHVVHGERRAELLQAARELFNDRGYGDTSTREIAQRADVSETLMFRYFGSKVGLFRAAVVQPFLDFVDEFTQTSGRSSFQMEDEEAATRQFLGGLYDVFHEHRGLVAMFFAAETMLSSELAESGVLAEVAQRLQSLVDIGREQLRLRHHLELERPWLTTRATLSMVAGMATFGPSFYGNHRASWRDRSQTRLGYHSALPAEQPRSPPSRQQRPASRGGARGADAGVAWPAPTASPRASGTPKPRWRPP